MLVSSSCDNHQTVISIDWSPCRGIQASEWWTHGHMDKMQCVIHVCKQIYMWCTTWCWQDRMTDCKKLIGRSIGPLEEMRYDYCRAKIVPAIATITIPHYTILQAMLLIGHGGKSSILLIKYLFHQKMCISFIITMILYMINVERSRQSRDLQHHHLSQSGCKNSRAVHRKSIVALTVASTKMTQHYPVWW